MYETSELMRHRHAGHHRALAAAHGNSTCPLGGQFGDVAWFSLQSVITTLNISAISANLFLMYICGRSGVMHRNTRLMLSTISGCFAVNATAGLLYNLYFFYLGANGFPSVPLQSVWCSVINTMMVPWDAATCCLFIGVGAERLIATKHHIPSGAISHYVKVIFLLAWAAAIFVTISFVTNLTDKGMCVCDGASLSERGAMLLRISICAVIEAGTISLFGYVLILSRSEADGLGINTAKYSLSKRFQIYETYRTTQMLLPSAVLHAILYLSYLCLLIPIRDLRAERTLTVMQFNLSTIIFSFPSIHALSHPLICLSRHYYLRQRVEDHLGYWFSRAPSMAARVASPDERNRLHTTPDELSSSQSFRSEHPSSRVDFRIAPERHAEILESFWDCKK